MDASGNAYVAGITDSTDFPTTAGAFQPTFGGGSGDAFVTKLAPTGSALAYSTYVGGSALDRARGIAVDALGNAYVTGLTVSTDFPTTAGAFQTGCPGPSCGAGFVTKLNPPGTTLVYSTYLGGNNSTGGTAIAVDAVGNASVTGSTAATDFPTTAGALQTSIGGRCISSPGPGAPPRDLPDTRSPSPQPASGSRRHAARSGGFRPPPPTATR